MNSSWPLCSAPLRQGAHSCFQWAGLALLLCFGTAPARSSLGHGSRSYFARARRPLRRQLGTGPVMPHSGKALPLTLLLGPRLILTPLGHGAPRTWQGAHSCFAWARRPLVLCYGTGPAKAATDLGPFILLRERNAHSYLRLTSASAHSGLTRVWTLPQKCFT